ncbi:MAG: hypothetical protein JWP19_2247 [Rhodoglobus sp.]|nr:hypothetical protein [Rhodoglobus sp.]
MSGQYPLLQLREMLTERDLAVLVDVDRFRLLSTRQIQRLHFTDHATGQAATRATHRVLQRLESHRVLARLERRVGGPQRGSAAALWQLGPRGIEALRPDAIKRGKVREPTSGLFVHHTTEVAEAAVEIIERAQTSGLDLLKLNPEQHAWVQFLGQHGQAEWLRPDLYVVAASQDYEQHTFLEVDRATEHGPQILRKCHVYARFAAVGAAERFAGLMPRVLWVVPDKRRQGLVRRLIDGDAQLPEGLFVVTTAEGALDLIFEGLNRTNPPVNEVTPRKEEPA